MCFSTNLMQKLDFMSASFYTNFVALDNLRKDNFKFNKEKKQIP